jgi:hypothetical protein
MLVNGAYKSAAKGLIDCTDIAYNLGVLLIQYSSKLFITYFVKSTEKLQGIFGKHSP